MTSKTKAAYWQKHLFHWQDSGLTQKGYCTQHTLKQADFGDWHASIKIEVPMGSLDEVLPILHLKALSDKVATEGLILTESQVTAMERKKEDDLW